MPAGPHQAVVVVLVEVFGQGGGHLCQVIHQADGGHRADDPGFDRSSTGRPELPDLHPVEHLRRIAGEAAQQVGLRVALVGLRKTAYIVRRFIAPARRAPRSLAQVLA